MRAVIYARVSSKEQEESGYSLPAQEKLLKEYAEKKGFEVAEVFSVSESAYGKVQRKVFHQMLAFMKRHRIPILIVETTDRLTRNFKEVMNIDKWLEENEEHQVHLVREGTILHKNARSHEWFVWRMKVATAEFYVRQLSENVKKGQEEKIREGWLPTKPPLGYKTVGEKGHKIHVLDEKVAPLVRKMFELYSSGNYSLKKMVEIMYKEGLRTRSGNKLVKSRLASLLSNPFYYGAVEWNGEIYPGKHEPLIPKELFDRVQIILKRKGVPKYRKHFPLFKGLIRCDECGGLITWETHKGHWYGACNHYRKCSQKGYVRQEKVEEQIIPYFEKLTIKNERLANWIKKALKESHRDEIEYHRSCINELRERYERIQKRLSLLYDDKLDGKITSDFYEEKLREYTKEKEEIINSIERHSNAQNKYFALGVNILELSQRAKEIYLMASEEQKRMLLNLVFSKITLNNGKIKVVYSKPFEICLKGIEFTNKIFEPEFSKQGEPKAPKISILLRGWNDFRTLKWVEEIECPELVINQVKELLQGYRSSLQ
jgi:DNA invertase Pin-like site-specific DNA recombinase/ssDNA-binding Zn-finger/Zn-ribbon topoisomerase 1